MIEPTDAEAIARSLKDPQAFEVVFHRHFAAIHRYLVRRVGAELAQELAAETFTVAFSRRHTFHRGSPDCKPWLYGIASNLAGSYHRRETRRLRAYARSAQRGVATAEDTLARLEAQSQRPALAQALAGLSKRNREALLLHALAELSHEEIARALGISTDLVRTRIHRARRSVTRALQGAEAELTDPSPLGNRRSDP
jgi:RNA polymerase sigma-70 factor (ECF subfamily)